MRDRVDAGLLLNGSAIDFGDAPVASSAALILAVVLAWAAQAKLRSPSQTVDDFTSLGLQRPHALAKSVPVGELVVAVLLLIQRQWGGVIAAAVIVGFTTIMIRVLRQPEAFAAASCACFGGSSHGRLSWYSIARNGVLLSLALLATFL